MVKFLLPHGTGTRANRIYYRAGNHARSEKSVRLKPRAPVFKFLGKFDPFKFYEDSRCIRVDLSQKPRGNSNNSFKPICYGLVQRRWNNRQGILGRVMFFLLRMAFWVGVVCVLLPSGSKTTSPDANIDATQAVTLASAAVSDMRGFCDRQPDACVVGGKVAVAIGHKAEAGARTIYDFITTKLNDATESADKTAAKPVPGQGTLSAADLQPAWHAPVPLPPRREARAARPAA